MSAYWVYENWRAGHTARIHRSACRHCKNGQGQKGGTDKENGRWLPGGDSLSAAEGEARQTGGEVEYCKACAP